MGTGWNAQGVVANFLCCWIETPARWKSPIVVYIMCPCDSWISNQTGD